MPKYTDDIVAGCCLYFTAKCIVEAVHLHASDKKLTEKDSAKFWVYEDGTSRIEKMGRLKQREAAIIQKWIQDNIGIIAQKWGEYADETVYKKK